MHSCITLKTHHPLPPSWGRGASPFHLAWDVGVSSISPVAVCRGFPPPPTAEAASLSPAKREAKREAKKCGRGVRKNQTSSGSLVRSLVVGTAADSEWICIAPDRILHQGAGSFHSGLDLRAPTCSDACHTMLNVRLSRPTQPLPHTSSYLIL